MILTLTEYKSFEALTKDDQDGKYNLLISAASNLIKTYLGSIFAPPVSPIEEYITVDYDTDRIWPKYWPISSLISVEEKPRYSHDSTVWYMLTAGADYELDGDSIVRIPRPGGFGTWRSGSVKIVYTGGFTEADAPNELKLACIELVNYYRDKGFLPNRSLQGATIITAGAGVPELPAHIRAILDQYRSS